MDCSKVEKELLNGVSGREIDEHIENCPECQIFRDSLDTFLPAKPLMERYVPSEKIDTAIMEAAGLPVDAGRHESESQKIIHPVHRRKIISYLASAACGVFIAWLVVVALESTQRMKHAGKGVSGVYLDTSGPDNSDNALSWSNVSMDDEFMDVTTDIEMNIMLISNNDDQP